MQRKIRLARRAARAHAYFVLILSVPGVSSADNGLASQFQTLVGNKDAANEEWSLHGQPRWALRYGLFLEPQTLNGNDLAFHGLGNVAQAAELEKNAILP